MQASFEAVYRRARQDPAGFWREALNQLHWEQRPTRIADDLVSPSTRWFADGRLNACFNAVDRHVESGLAEQAAIIYDSPVTQQRHVISYSDLQYRVAAIAGMLAATGVGVGDRVVIYMPMIPEAVMAMLACARIGAIHSVVFGGFAAKELAVRIDDAQPKAILSASCGIETTRIIAYKPLLEEAIRLATHKPKNCFVLQREQLKARLNAAHDVDWLEAERLAEPADCVPVPSGHPLYILYTSGTTGQPKGVVHDTGGYLVALMWSMKHIYDIDSGDVFWAASDVGWVVGHSYICYGPLTRGATTVLYEGKPVGTPDAGAFWRVIAENRVKALFTAPTAMRAIKKEDPLGLHFQHYDTSCLETLFLAGERCDPATLDWAGALLGVPVIDHWWQTETGWAICANCKGIELLPIKAGSPTRAVPGYDVDAFDRDGNALEPGELGALVIKLPLPPGTFTGLWNNEKRFIESYFSRYAGYYETGDAGYIDEDGYVFVMSRTDDVINVAGHRLSTGAIEEVLASHADVAECAVIGVADSLKGQLPLGMVVLKAGIDRDSRQIVEECTALVRTQIGPVAVFRLCMVVNGLPKTRSGKILRGSMSKIADGEPWKTPATIDDPAILDEITAALLALGYPLRPAELMVE